MNKKKVPQRQCIGCQEMKGKKEMIRVIKSPLDEIMLDSTGKMNGRGAYICKHRECFDKAVKSKALERSMKMAIPDTVYEILKKELGELESK